MAEKLTKAVTSKGLNGEKYLDIAVNRSSRR
jgi:hypothetical protein